MITKIWIGVAFLEAIRLAAEVKTAGKRVGYICVAIAALISFGVEIFINR